MNKLLVLLVLVLWVLSCSQIPDTKPGQYLDDMRSTTMVVYYDPPVSIGDTLYVYTGGNNFAIFEFVGNVTVPEGKKYVSYSQGKYIRCGYIARLAK